MLPFNRDRIYKGTVEAAAFRRVFNPWTWRGKDDVRSILEQLRLQPPGMADDHKHKIWRARGGASDGRVRFAFDPSPDEVPEPPPCPGTCPEITTAYSFDRQEGTGSKTTVTQEATVVVLTTQQCQ